MTILREENLCPIDHEGFDQIVDLAVETLQSGEVIAYPTETLYGLGCDYMNVEGYHQILGLKKLKEAKPFILLIPHECWINKLSGDQKVQEMLKPLIDKFWPGPLTVMIESSSRLPRHLVGSGGKISMRLSPDPFVQALLGKYRRPITSTSANPTGKPPASEPSELRTYFSSSGDLIDLAIYGGERSGLPSTLVNVSENGFEVLREGAIPASRILKTCQT
jgi:L-threonylcarbamoyladenylate synthase